MKESTLFLTNKINDIAIQFPKLKIRYEFRSSISTHLIEIQPFEDFDSNQEYIKFEMAIEDEFEKLFGSKEDILFISSESLMQIRNVDLSWGYDSFIIPNEQPYPNHLINSLFQELITADDTSYALAA
jgi:hypothetical protein